MGKPIATKGQEIRDENGKLYATVLKDISGTDAIRLEMFKFTGRTPQTGEPIPRILYQGLLECQHNA